MDSHNKKSKSITILTCLLLAEHIKDIELYLKASKSTSGKSAIGKTECGSTARKDGSYIGR